MTIVNRRDRVTDLAALLLIAAGAALFVWSFWRLQEISHLTYAHPGPRGTSALKAADFARYVHHAGVALVVAGVVAAVASAVRHRGRGAVPLS